MDLERIREVLRTPTKDALSARAALDALRPMVAELIEAYEVERGRDGGKFGRRLLEAIESQVVTNEGEPQLTEDVTVRSLAATVLSGSVFIDIRMEVKCQV